MKNSFKNRKKLIILALIFLAGCSENFLDLDNPNKLTTQSYWKTGAELEAGLVGVYKAFSEGANWSYWQRTNVQLVEGRTENFTISKDVNSRYQISMFTNTPENSSSEQIYLGCYTGIFRANQVIHNADGINDISTDYINQIIAEAKFCRALNYFNLVNEFGSVPIIIKPAESEQDYFSEKSPPEKIWEQIINDLRDAIPYLPYSYPEEQKGRATRGAAKAFLGKAFLYLEDWSNTINILEEIVTNEDKFGYGLMPDYADNFNDQNENNIESVFEIQYSRLRSPVWGGPDATSTVIAQECAPYEKGGWEELKPTKVLLDAFLKEKTKDGGIDPRAMATLAWSYPGSTFYQSAFDSIWDEHEIHLKKNQNWWNENEGDWRSGLNEHPMRYADVLLMLAEAYTMQNNIVKASILVHRIRNRAQLTDISSAMLNWNQGRMIQEIRHQRNLEFAREMVHWFDLRRWGILKETIKNSGVEGHQNFTSKHEYYPIPEEELRNNPSMTQNAPWN